jgi:hypothetical protein
MKAVDESLAYCLVKAKLTTNLAGRCSGRRPRGRPSIATCAPKKLLAFETKKTTTAKPSGKTFLDPLHGVRPLGWTGSGCGFDRLPGVVILEL